MAKADYRARIESVFHHSLSISSWCPLYALVGQCWRPDALSAVEHRPADVVPQPLVVEDERANRLRELVALPPALASSCALARSFRRGGAGGLDCIGGRSKLVRGDVCDACGLAGSVRGMPCCSTQVSCRAHCMAARRASLGHRDLATHPGAGLRDRLSWSGVLRLSRREEVKNVLRARCRPQGEELVICIGEGPTAADRHEPRVALFREDHGQHPFCSQLPNESSVASRHRITTLRRQPPACPPDTGNAAVGHVRDRSFRRLVPFGQIALRHRCPPPRAFVLFASTVIWLKETRQRTLENDEDNEDEKTEEAEEPEFRGGPVRIHDHQAGGESADEQCGRERERQSAHARPCPERENRQCGDQARPNNADESPLSLRKCPPPIRKRFHPLILHERRR